MARFLCGKPLADGKKFVWMAGGADIFVFKAK
jgi:hypothetical protein